MRKAGPGTWTRTTRVILLIMLALAGMPGLRAAAHPMGNFAICHFSAVRAHRDAIRIHYIIDIAEYPTYGFLRDNDIDTDGDREYSDAEIEAYRLAWLEPTIRTVEVLQFCSWSACRISSRFRARSSTCGTLYVSAGTANIMLMKFWV